jgi:hypothetical protein
MGSGGPRGQRARGSEAREQRAEAQQPRHYGRRLPRARCDAAVLPRGRLGRQGASISGARGWRTPRRAVRTPGSRRCAPSASQNRFTGQRCTFINKTGNTGAGQEGRSNGKPAGRPRAVAAAPRVPAPADDPRRRRQTAAASHAHGLEQAREVELGGGHLLLHDLEARLLQRRLDVVLGVKVCARGLFWGGGGAEVRSAAARGGATGKRQPAGRGWEVSGRRAITRILLGPGNSSPVRSVGTPPSPPDHGPP